jgi:hypothetical protein
LAGIQQRWWFSANPQPGDGGKLLAVKHLRFGLERAYSRPRRVFGNIAAAVREVEE